MSLPTPRIGAAGEAGVGVLMATMPIKSEPRLRNIKEGPDGKWSSLTYRSSSYGLVGAVMRSESRDSWAAAAIKFKVNNKA